MAQRFSAVNPKFPHMLHGGDYSPEQWLDTPAVLDEDVRLMKLSGCNVMSVGIFSWSMLEPREGQYNFGWLDTVMDKLAAGGVTVMLATPTAVRPQWMGQKYPEVLRVNREGRRTLTGWRGDHCPSSPVYREKSREINTRLAERYGKHPALLAWHVNNEFGGECACDLCRMAFGEWARKKFNNDIHAANEAWWAAFWGRSYADFSEIGNPQIHPLDWRRFTSDQIISYFLDEIRPLRQISPDVPLTTNFMGLYGGINYWEFAKHVDFACWDSYPHWHRPGVSDARTAAEVAFIHDIYRSFKGGMPFVLMESQPQISKGRGVLPLKRPGVHQVTSLQAVAHGADSVQYFQWRKGRGGEEKFHGAVVDHVGHENTRGFRDVAEVGRVLAKLDAVVGTSTKADAALVYDWESRWALEHEGYLGDAIKQYGPICQDHYEALWRRGVSVDVVDQTADLSGYKLVIAPVMYMIRPGADERIAQFVEQGGTFVTTYGSGMVDEHDRALLGGCPGGRLRKLLGIWHEETDGLYPEQANELRVAAGGAGLGLKPAYELRDICGVIHAEGARVLGTYGRDFYAGSPALTVNTAGKGRAYYQAAKASQTFLFDFYAALTIELKLRRATQAELPEGVSATVRSDGKTDFVFLMNFSAEEKTVAIDGVDMVSGQKIAGKTTLKPYGYCIVARA